MANGMTPHYGLNQWAGEDQFVRAEFNADNEKVDAALHGLAGAVAEKAPQAELDGLAGVVETKAAQSALDGLAATVGTKAAQTALDSLTAVVNTKASQSDLNALSGTVGTKAAQTALNSLSGTVTSLTATVNTKASQAALNALTATVNGKGNCQIGTGSYVGDGTESRSLTFPVRPLLAVIAGPGAPTLVFSGMSDSGITVPTSGDTGSTDYFVWSGNTVTFTCYDDDTHRLMNNAGMTYRYFYLTA